MYSKRSPPTLPAGIEFPYISILARCGMAPSTGISLLRRYSSILGSIGVAIDYEFSRTWQLSVCGGAALVFQQLVKCIRIQQFKRLHNDISREVRTVVAYPNASHPRAACSLDTSDRVFYNN